MNGNPDVFVRDRVTGITELISRGLDGLPATGDTPVISGDGKIVAFRSSSDTLVSEGNPNFTTHIYAFDRSTQTIERVDVDSNGVLADSQANNLATSGDGRYVAFDTFADNLVAGPGDQQGVDVFVRDRLNHITDGISTVGDNGIFEGHSLRPAADLALTKNDSPDPVVVRANLTYTVTVRNLGPAAARDVTTFDQLPADAVFISATPTQGSCARSRDGVLTCALGTVNPFAAPTVTIVVSPSRSGVTLTNSATVRANSPDPDLANNRATATTTVVAK